MMQQSKSVFRLCIFFGLLFVHGPVHAEQPLNILMIGDSLTAGLGLAKSQAYPAKLTTSLQEKNIRAVIHNRGVSGDTTKGGLTRLEWVMSEKPNGVILALGANDALRGIPAVTVEDNIDKIIQAVTKKHNTPLFLVGILPPSNMGAKYQEQFQNLFQGMSKKHDIPLYPFFLEGVATDPSLNQSDGIHPNEAGVQVMVQKTLPAISAWLQSLPQK